LTEYVGTCNTTLGAGYTQKCTFQGLTSIGNVIFESGETFTVMQGARREYNIPKSAVEAFNGSELYLSISFSEILNYKVA